MSTQTELANAPAGGRRQHWLGLALAGFILLMLAFWLDLGEVAAVFGQMSLPAVVIILALLALDRVVMAWKWLLLLRVGGIDLPLKRVIRWYFQSTLCGAFVPSTVAGDVLRGCWAGRSSGQLAFVFASLVMERILGLLSAVHWGIAGGVILISWRAPNLIWLWLALGTCAIVSTAAAFMLSLHPRVHALFLRALSRLQSRRGVGILQQLYEAYSCFSMARGALLRNYFITLAEHLLQMTIFLTIAIAIGSAQAPILFLAVTTLHTMLLRIPISPEGWGIGELSAIGFYSLIGIGSETAFAIMFVFHVAVLIACSPGFLFLLRGERLPQLGSVSARSPAVSE